jgi:hypothetical protein
MVFFAAARDRGASPYDPTPPELGHLSLTLEPLATAVGANERKGWATD